MKHSTFNKVKLFLLFLLPLHVSAADWYVNNNSTSGDIYTSAVGNNGNNGTAAAPFLTLNFALTQANAGDRIFVDVGTYTGAGNISINFNKAITVIGAGTSNTIFTSHTDDRFGLISANNVHIQNLQIFDFFLAGAGQALFVNANITGFQLTNVVMKKNLGENSAGESITLSSGSSSVFNGLVFSCSGFNGDSGGAVKVNNATLVANNCIFFQSRDNNGVGGAIELFGANPNVTVNNTTFESNIARAGGAIAQSSGTLIVNNSCFNRNYINGDSGGTTNGGGHYYSRGSDNNLSATFTNCSFTGAFFCATTNPSGFGCEFSTNTSNDGNGISLRETAGTFMFDQCFFNNSNQPGANFDNGLDLYLHKAGGATMSVTINNSKFGNDMFGGAVSGGADAINIWNQNLSNTEFIVTNSGVKQTTANQDGIDGDNYSYSGTEPGGNDDAQTSNTIVTCQSGISSCAIAVNCATDAFAPIILACAPNQTITDCSGVLPDYRPLLSVYDDCNLTIVQSPAPGTVLTTLGNGNHVITFTVSDESPVSADATCTMDLTLSNCVVCIPPADVTGVADQSFCAVTTLTLGDIVINTEPGATVLYYDAAVGGNLLDVNDALVDGVTYYIAQSLVVGCESATRLEVTVHNDDNGFFDFASAVRIQTNQSPATNTIYNTTGAGVDCINTNCAEQLNGTDFGSFDANSGDLKITGGEIKTAITLGNVCSATMSYRVYRVGDVAGPFSVLPLSALEECVDTGADADLNPDTFADGFGPCNSNDQKWKNYGFDIDLTNTLCTGNYILEVFYSYVGSGCDANGCTDTKNINNNGLFYSATFAINDFTAAIIDDHTDPTCSVATGSVDLSGLPAGNWTLQENTNNTTITGNTATATFPNLISGDYNFTIFNADNCPSLVSANVTIAAQPQTPAAPTIDATNQTTCASAVGSVDFSGLPAGNWTITESLNNTTLAGNTATASFINLGAGTYSFTVTNDEGCTSLPTADVTINVQPQTPATPTIDATNQTSCASAVGSVNFSNLPAGDWTITESLNNTTLAGNTATASFINLGAGTYSFTVTNDEGCTSPSTANVTIDAQPQTPAAPTIDATNQTTCASAVGSVNFSGLPAGDWLITESLNNTTLAGNTSTASFINLGAGTYSFTVTNDEGCTSPASADIIINVQPQTPTAPTIDATNQTSCASAVGSVNFSNLPAGDWTITESLNNTTLTGNTATASFINLGAGTYSFTVTNDEGCTSPSTANVTIDAQPQTPATPTIDATNQTTCASAVGSVNFSGLPAGNWTITESLNNTTSAGNTATASFINLGPGTYSFTLTNDEGCTSPSTANVTIDAQPQTPATPTIDATNQTTCASAVGSLDFSNLPAGDWLITESLNNTTLAGNTATASFLNLGAGTYSFTVTNDDGCTSLPTADVTINVQPQTPATPTIDATNQTSCASTVGSVDFSNLPAGDWLITESLNNTTLAGNTATASFNNLGAGTYSFTVTNDEGCTSPSTADVTINVQPQTPSTPTITATNQTTCASAVGSVDFSNLPAGDWLITESLNNTTLTGNTATASFFNLEAGTYSFTVTNDEGCTSLPTADVTINVQPQTPSTPTITATNQTSCASAVGSVNFSGLPAGDWLITESLNNTTLIGNTATASFINLEAGTYSFTVTNDDGCTSLPTSDVTINVQPQTPSTPTITATNQTSCASAVGSVNFSGLPAGDWLLTESLNNTTLTGNTTTASFINLGAGTYSFTVTNDDGCTSLPTANVTINVQPQTPATPTIDATNQTTCASAVGSVDFSNLPAGDWLITESFNNTTLAGNTATASFINLAAGTYSFTVTNDDGCTSLPTASVIINVQPQTPPAPLGNTPQLFCVEDNATVADLEATGTAINWYMSAIGGVSLGSDVVLTTNTSYFASQTVGGCESTDRLAVVVVINQVLLDTVATKTPTCGLSDGTIEVIATGGNGPYSYTWNSGQNGVLIENINNGTFVATATDVNGCVASLTKVMDCNFAEIPEIITPGGNGQNETWVIGLSEAFPDMEVKIFNRWGNEVFTASPYLDDWNGKCNVGIKIGDEFLPSGTYFYIIDLKNGDKPKSGYIELVK
jgi:gliding motility-associated-like protein